MDDCLQEGNYVKKKMHNFRQMLKEAEQSYILWFHTKVLTKLFNSLRSNCVWFIFTYKYGKKSNVSKSKRYHSVQEVIHNNQGYFKIPA